MTEFKWQIDSIRTVLFFNGEINFKKKEWSKNITGLEISNEMTQSEENGRLIQYVEITNLDSNKQFNLVYLKDQSLIDLQLVFERDENFYTFNEIIKEVDFFYEKISVFFDQLNEKIIRIGNVVELSIPVDNEKIGCDLLRSNVSYLNNMQEDLEEISYRTNKSYFIDNIKINQVVQYSNGQKMSLVIDPNIGIPKAKVQKNILMNIDVNTDASHRSELDFLKFIPLLQDSVKKLIRNGGTYVS
ncbi:hypothetical protein J7S89_09015 [Acinetobacter baumannii]|uniref:TIGR04255 family protein n=36 Tax=Acinetobacter baumannii TaxID=470 RepID=R4L7N0_ACIBA|nr:MULTISPECIES: hypothetical protein [Acinetobacter]ETY67229.1 hypothetical protein X964_16700 [Acinetobacter baumannii MDR_MMC4]EXD21673.1 hypothetical protein J480_3823 [Acinetobacter baumannii 34654]EYD45824.1 hypothetical protein J917_3956 [Acinetobacter baumannii 25493_4]KCX51448.1 hypothetical protein J528_3697 [Acinetobacter baumannii 135867]KCY68522.1 hypothetical protein J608_1517 [Acinetobacter baumannii 1288284]